MKTLNGHFDLKRKHWDMHLWGFGAESGSRAGTAGALDPNGNANTEQFLGDVRFSSEDWFEDIELTAHASYLYTNFLADLNLFP
ncbi:hypothetical protein [Methylocucumis oryzae]|uniref:hypothetical protein n=1 Tax=Methylocucumis oryzae TaxID=1632867 RepID=UPI00069781B5|nr:hypothetical protein [Methylocucumis oryzae]